MTLDKFEEASERVKEVILPTNLIYSEYYSAQTGAKVYFKPENMQYTGAYKVRGAYYKISTLSEEERAKGLITASAGNHAQGVAYAAKIFGVKAVIVMPTTTPLIKVNRTKSYGAEVVLHGDVYDDACAYAMKLAEENGYTFVHPLMTKSLLPDRDRSQWRSLKNFLPLISFSTDRWRWTCLWCFDTCKIIESKHYCNRCRTGGCKLYAGFSEKRRSHFTAWCKYDCRRYCRKNTGIKYFPIHSEKH